MPTDHIRTLRKMLETQRGILLPGAPNALAARIIADLGFEAVYLTGLMRKRCIKPDKRRSRCDHGHRRRVPNSRYHLPQRYRLAKTHRRTPPDSTDSARTPRRPDDSDRVYRIGH